MNIYVHTKFGFGNYEPMLGLSTDPRLPGYLETPDPKIIEYVPSSKPDNLGPILDSG